MVGDLEKFRGIDSCVDTLLDMIVDEAKEKMSGGLKRTGHESMQ